VVRTLAFDCSTSRGSVALLQDDEVLHAGTFECPRGRGGEFFSELERVMKSAKELHRVVVGIGPGSYNGLRASISAAEGLCLATGAGLVGVASVRAIPCEHREYVVVNDVRGAMFSFVKVREREIVGEIELLDAGRLMERVAAETAPIFANAPVDLPIRVEIAFPDARILAGLGARGAVNPGVEPLYLKPAHITKPKPSGLRRGGK
jgi:tRNA threonylcarbamoyladenosine biosynthesis protein TsaB